MTNFEAEKLVTELRGISRAVDRAGKFVERVANAVRASDEGLARALETAGPAIAAALAGEAAPVVAGEAYDAKKDAEYQRKTAASQPAGAKVTHGKAMHR